MKTLDIDNVEPKLLLEMIERNKKVDTLARFDMRTTYGHWRGAHMKLGVSYERLLNWRALERRAFELQTVRRQYSETFWSGLQKLSGDDKRTVWLPTPEGDYVNVFDGDTLGTRSTKELVDRGIRDSKLQPIVVSGETLASFHRCRMREFVYVRRASSYIFAFRQAVEFRLREFVEANLHTKSKYILYEPSTFILMNEDRTYIIRSNEHVGFTWIDDGVFVCPAATQG